MQILRHMSTACDEKARQHKNHTGQTRTSRWMNERTTERTDGGI